MRLEVLFHLKIKCYVAVDAFGFHQSYLLHWCKRVQLRHVFYMKISVLWMVSRLSIHRIQAAHLPSAASLRRHLFIAHLI
ncbi:hypothetical protein SFRURICE_019739 [Spodoptera frugiperda]|nr:hypothetical protein SFRURICE_019739 [Spodoptera frugiperda]